jgi:hypothetical protein
MPIILPFSSRSSFRSLSFWLYKQNPIDISLLPYACYISCPYLILFDLIILMILIKLGEDYKLRSSPLCSLLQTPVSLSLFCANILLNTLFPNTLRLYSSLLTYYKRRNSLQDP